MGKPQMSTNVDDIGLLSFMRRLHEKRRRPRPRSTINLNHSPECYLNNRYHSYRMTAADAYS